MIFFNIFFHKDAKGDYHKNFSRFGRFWKNGLIEQNRKSLIALRSASTPPSGLKFLVHKLGPIWIITPGGKIGYLEFSKSRPTLIPTLLDLQSCFICTTHSVQNYEIISPKKLLSIMVTLQIGKELLLRQKKFYRQTTEKVKV